MESCWCTWDESWLPLSHDEFAAANDYPPHEVSPVWNLPEPDEVVKSDADPVP